MIRFATLISVLVISTPSVFGDVITATPNHYRLHHETTSELPPDQLWQRLIDPKRWWLSDHTYSGSSDNLSLELKAGGAWREDWEGGSVLHGTVLYFSEGKQLRLDAPFGPLQELGVTTIWTITIKPNEDGSVIVFDEVANGSHDSGLDELAQAVDFVKQQAIQSLAKP